MALSAFERGRAAGVAECVGVRAAARQLEISRGCATRAFNEINTRHKARKVSKSRQARINLCVNLAKKKTTVNGRTFPTFSSSRVIARRLGQLGKPVSHMTVWRDLRAKGLKSFVRRRVPGNDPEYRQRRKNFCANKEWRKQRVTDRIVFSDEHWITSNDHTTRSMWAKSKKDILPRPVRSRYNVPSLMIWAAIGIGWRSKLVVVPRTVDEATGKTKGMNSTMYVRRCLSKIVPHLLKKKAVFMQDGARCHTSAWTKEYLGRKGVDVMTGWPSHSPDLNPIEPLWCELDRRIAEMGVAKDTKELASMATAAWDAMPQRLIDSYVRSFPGRVKKCVSCNGGCT